MRKFFQTSLVSDSYSKINMPFPVLVFKLTMSKLILENKGALAHGMTEHLRAAKKWWAATAGAAAMAMQRPCSHAAPQQP